ncbi:MAG: hypothetical protein QOH12_3523 [Solirubrobacteraceae bacterium]|nr:hypothetical protein [Solirubrobacteraceae bacterium]
MWIDCIPAGSLRRLRSRTRHRYAPIPGPCRRPGAPGTSARRALSRSSATLPVPTVRTAGLPIAPVGRRIESPWRRRRRRGNTVGRDPPVEFARGKPENRKTATSSGFHPGRRIVDDTPPPRAGREDLLNAGSSSTASRNRPTDCWPADHSRDRVRPGDCPGGSTSWRTAGAPSSAGRRDVRSSSRLGPGSHRHMKRSTLCPTRCRSKPSRSCPVGAPDGRDRVGGRVPRGCSHPHQRKPSPMI